MGKGIGGLSVVDILEPSVVPIALAKTLRIELIGKSQDWVRVCPFVNGYGYILIAFPDLEYSKTAFLITPTSPR